MRHLAFPPTQRGATLIEVMVAVVILSIGLLSLAAMMAYATVLPKFSGNRSIAISTAANMIDRMRANPTTVSPTFSLAAYAVTTVTLTPTSASITSSASTCVFPTCTQTTMATMDIAIIQQQLAQQLAPAGMTIEVTDAANNEGNLWVFWQEPSSFASFISTGNDNCPANINTLGFSSTPRCVYLPFKL